MNSDWFIYALLDRDSRIRYIGRSHDVHKRLQSHWERRKSKNEPLHHWLRTLSDKPEIRILSSHPYVAAHQSEMLWIRVMRQQPSACGPGLLNLRPDYSFKLSAEARDKIGEVHRGKSTSLETRARLAEAGKRPENVVRLIGLSRSKSPETRAKISAANKGKPSAKGMLGKKHSPETRARMSEAHRLRFENPAERQKRSNAAKRDWAKRKGGDSS